MKKGLDMAKVIMVVDPFVKVEIVNYTYIIERTESMSHFMGSKVL